MSTSTLLDTESQISATVPTLAMFVEQLGNVPLNRIRANPAVGLATEADLIANNAGKAGLCELIDGALVEKPVGYFESRLAVVLMTMLEIHLSRDPLGIVVGPDAPTRFIGGVVRLPDVSFVRLDRLPGGQTPREPIASLPPDLTVEILSASNTKEEMDRKVNEYFASGVRLVWIVDPPSRTAKVYTSPQQVVKLGPNDVLNGGDVIPGFELSIREWFEKAR